MAKLVAPNGRTISVNADVFVRLKERGYKDPNELKSIHYKVDEVKNMTSSMTPEEIDDFIEGDERKTVKSWAGQSGTETD